MKIRQSFVNANVIIIKIEQGDRCHGLHRAHDGHYQRRQIKPHDVDYIHICASHKGDCLLRGEHAAEARSPGPGVSQSLAVALDGIGDPAYQLRKRINALRGINDFHPGRQVSNEVRRLDAATTHRHHQEMHVKSSRQRLQH